MASEFDVIIIGAGAAGLMCAIEAGRRGRSVLVIEHSVKPAEKIRISGGGRCNFTNVHTGPSDFLSGNPHFCKSALGRFTPQDIIDRVREAGIAFHEKTLGQLFCDESSDDVIQMLLGDARKAGVQIRTQTSAQAVTKDDSVFAIRTGPETVTTGSLVIASGGRSIPKMGSSGFATDIAQQFDINVLPQRAGLVPLTFSDEMKAQLGGLTGVSLDVEVSHGKTKFKEALLFTHRGLSGPAILQISSYWREGDDIIINLAPGVDITTRLLETKRAQPRETMVNVLASSLPRRLAQVIAEEAGAAENLAEAGDKLLAAVGERVNRWRIKPQGSEGYRTAEVTLGGIDTKALSSKTMEARAVSGLYFIGEAVDVTGHLGGFNFQWAWASGFAAGQVV